MQYACIALSGSSKAELEDKRDHYDRVGKRESDDRSGRIPLKSGGLDSLKAAVYILNQTLSKIDFSPSFIVLSAMLTRHSLLNY